MKKTLVVALCAIATAFAALVAHSCSRPSMRADSGTMQTVAPGERAGDEIAVLGLLYPSGSRVVLWDEPDAFNGYLERCHFTPERIGPSQNPDRVRRYGPLRKNLPAEITARIEESGWRLDDLRATIGQIVIHYDACATSRQCFKVLHDIRGLSCHFLLDLDGTIYQTLDVKERAWHAGIANDLSIGIEIAHPGAFGDHSNLANWYRDQGDGMRLVLPEPLGDGGLPSGFVPRPARAGPHRGTINGQSLVQLDFTEEQYHALEQLLVTLCRLFPAIRPDVPRRADGTMLLDAFPSREELDAYRGLLGHFHVTTGKVDPGPAFDWDRVLSALTQTGGGDDSP